MSAAAEPPPEASSSSSAAAAPAQLSSLRIFQQLDAVQNNHGVPVGDYAQYQAYCTRRLSRLRHNRAVRTQLVHNPRYVEGVSGRRHAYCPRDWDVQPPTTSSSAAAPGEDDEADESKAAAEEAPPPPVHENVFWNLFFQAERAWAQACSVQQQPAKNKAAAAAISSSAGKSPSGKKSSNHAHVQRRLNKASKWAAALAEKVASSRQCDAATVRECEAYADWMAANVALEHRRYAAAFRHYKSAMMILHQLAAQALIESSSSSSSAAADSGADSSASSGAGGGGGGGVQALAIRDIWTQRAETVIKPLLRYCQYEAKDELGAEEVREIGSSAAAAAAPSSHSSASIVLNFRGTEIALDADASYKKIAVLYLKMEESLKHPDALDESQFLQLLSDLDDAVQMVADEIKSYQAVLNPGPAVTAKLADLTALEGWFRYQKLSIWSHQQEQHIAELQSDAEIVHLYDALQKNAVAMAELPGTSGEDDPYLLEAQAHIVRIRALRCYHLARVYETTLQGTTPRQVLALLQQSTKLAKRATEEIAACEMTEEEADHHLNALDGLAVKIRAMKCRVEAAKYLESSASAAAAAGGSVKTDRPLWLRLEELDAGTVLADDPPMPIPIPCKGVFYDIAGQRILGANDELLATIEEYIGSAEKPKKTGFFGWF